jgi:hypothetical protein
MQGEENTIEATTLDRGDDRVAKPLERRSLYFAARPRRRTEYVFDSPAMRLAHIEEAGELGIGLTSRGDGFVSKANETVPKCLFAGLESTEGVGLVREFCSEDPKCHQASISSGRCRDHHLDKG